MDKGAPSSVFERVQMYVIAIVSVYYKRLFAKKWNLKMTDYVEG